MIITFLNAMLIELEKIMILYDYLVIKLIKLSKIGHMYLIQLLISLTKTTDFTS
jgi:hypothetical protein